VRLLKPGAQLTVQIGLGSNDDIMPPPPRPMVGGLNDPRAVQPAVKRKDGQEPRHCVDAGQRSGLWRPGGAVRANPQCRQCCWRVGSCRSTSTRLYWVRCSSQTGFPAPRPTDGPGLRAGAQLARFDRAPLAMSLPDQRPGARPEASCLSAEASLVDRRSSWSDEMPTSAAVLGGDPRSLAQSSLHHFATASLLLTRMARRRRCNRPCSVSRQFFSSSNVHDQRQQRIGGTKNAERPAVRFRSTSRLPGRGACPPGRSTTSAKR
jgi:hypothetical protein